MSLGGWLVASIVVAIWISITVACLGLHPTVSRLPLTIVSTLMTLLLVSLLSFLYLLLDSVAVSVQRRLLGD